MIQHVSNHIAVMKDGEVVEAGSVEDIFGAPKHAYTRRLLDAVPKLPKVAPQPAHLHRCYPETMPVTGPEVRVTAIDVTAKADALQATRRNSFSVTPRLVSSCARTAAKRSSRWAGSEGRSIVRSTMNWP